MRVVRFAALAVTAACCILQSHPVFAAKNAGISHVKFVVENWRLEVETDRFSSIRRCRLRLRNDKAEQIDRSVMFDLSKPVDISTATIRFDDAEPLYWRDLMPVLALRGSDAAHGWGHEAISIPVTLLGAVKRVGISGSFGRRPRLFNIGGFSDAKSLAMRAGCALDVTTVR